MKNIRFTLAFTGCLALFAGTTHAADLIDSSFDLNPSTTVDTTGTADWGYWVFADGTDAYMDDLAVGVPTNFDSLTYPGGEAGASIPATVSESVPTIGDVIYEATDDSGGTSNVHWGFSFDGIAVGQIIGNIAGGEEIFQMTFNNLGVGTHTMSFYIGASATSRAIEVDYDIFEDDAPTLSAANITSGNFGSVDSNNQRIVYSLSFDTTTENTDLVFTLGSAGGGGNAFTMSGYTFETVVPEPSTFALIGLAGLFLLRRRCR